MHEVSIRMIVKKVQKAVPELDEKMDLWFLALIQPEEGMRHWDVVVASPGLSSGSIESYNLVVDIIHKKLDPAEMWIIGRYVIMNETDENLKFMMEELPELQQHKLFQPLEYPMDFGKNVIEDRLGFDIRGFFLLRNRKEKVLCDRFEE